MIKNVFLFAGIMLFLSGCTGLVGPSSSTSADAKKNSTMPEWALHIRSDNQMYYYAIGSGESIEAAKNDALGQISAKISVRIDSLMETKKSSAAGSFFSESTQEVKAKAKQIEFSNYSIVKKAFMADSFYVMVEVDRQALFTRQKKQFDRLHDTITTEIDKFSTYNKVEQLQAKAGIEEKIAQAYSQISILEAIKTDFAANSYTTKYSDFASAYQDLAKEVTFALQTDKLGKNYLAPIRSALSAEGVNFSSQGVYTLLIKAHAQPKKVRSANVKVQQLSFAQVKLSFSIQKNGEILASNSLTLLNASSAGYEEAMMKTDKLQKMIDKEGVFGLLLGR